MEFIDDVKTRSGRFANRLQHSIDTEEATKTSFVLPFIQMLGYDFFDPAEVVPEFTADVGTKKGEKVDYALMQDGAPIILIECKKVGAKLDVDEMSQLLRYFTVTNVRLGILTDGIVYRFFCDLDQPNVMDPRPFFEFNMLDFTDPQAKELVRFTKAAFDLDSIVEAARDLKYTTQVKRVLAEELANPSSDFVTVIIRQVYEGKITKSVREMFEALVRQAFKEFLIEQVNARLKSALERGEQAALDTAETPVGDEPEFAPRELEALKIVKAVVAGTVDVRRVGLRASSGSYCNVMLHDTETQDGLGTTVCRLWVRDDNFLRIRLADERLQEPLDDLDSIYNYADGLRRLVAENGSEDIPEPPTGTGDE